MSGILLDVKNLRTVFHTNYGDIQAVNGLDLTVNRGEFVAIVGESGSGKSVTALSIMRLLPFPAGGMKADKLQFDGMDLLKLSEKEMSKIRGNEISMVYQEPMTSLNPVFSVGQQIIEALQIHRGLGKKAAREKAEALLRMVEISSPQKRIDDFPHQLSGGMRQRVMIAMALACSPSLLIADEPTTALDVTIQAQILDLLCMLQEEMGMAIMLITHNLGIVADVVERVLVMYAGSVIENADVYSLFDKPLHPYSQGLLASLPRLDLEKEYLSVIPGVVPDPLNLPPGCRFHPRCSQRMDICEQEDPPLFSHKSRQVRCWLYRTVVTA